MEDRLTPHGIVNDCEQLEQLGLIYMDFKSAYNYLADTLKTIESKCYFESNESSIESRKMDSKRHPTYVEHIEQMNQVRTKMYRAEIQYNTAITKLDMFRSMEATNRKLM